MDVEHVVAGTGRPFSLVRARRAAEDLGEHVRALDPEVEPLREGPWVIDEGEVVVPAGAQPGNQPGDDGLYVAALGPVFTGGRYLVGRKHAVVMKSVSADFGQASQNWWRVS